MRSGELVVGKDPMSSGRGAFGRGGAKFFSPAGKMGAPGWIVVGSWPYRGTMFAVFGIPRRESACTAGRSGQTSSECPHGESHNQPARESAEKAGCGLGGDHDGSAQHMMLTGKR